ncbi:MAG TPA: hypothetical protein VI279_01815 [Rhodocyclaceae bacterium]
MSQSLADLLPGGDGRLGIRLWLKSAAYSQRLLLGEAGDPWESASKYLAYFSQAHGLLKPDVAVLEVGGLFESWLKRNPTLKVELLSKRKMSFPLRKLLEQSQPREVLAEVIEALVAHLRGQTPLLLAMPSPRRWLQLANQWAGRDEFSVDDDGIEDSAMYMADLLRFVSNLAVGGILLEEGGDSSAATPLNLELYRPLINVTKHYRWPLALHLGDCPVAEQDANQDIDLFIGKAGLPALGSAQGIDVSERLWADAAPALADRQFYFVEIPRDATPETVLENLARLRS